MDRILRDKKAILFFTAPAAILFLCILVYPILYALYISLCQWNGIEPPQFIGIGNFITLFKDAVFLTAVKNTFFIAIFSVVTQQILGLFLAVVLSNIARMKNVYKNIYYLPCVLSSAALGLLFTFLLNPAMGINILLEKAGMQGPLWLMDISWWIPLPIWVIGTLATWQYLGQTMMLYMAAIAGIDESLYEASYIDGATKIQAFRLITLPLIKPMAKISISLTCIGSLKFFDLIWNMTQGGPNHMTEVIATYLYQTAFKYFDYGLASTMSVVLLVLCLVITFLINVGIKSEDY